MGANGQLRETSFVSITAGTNSKTCSFELGGSAFLSRAETGGTVAALRDQREICNRNSVSSQVSRRVSAISGFGQNTNATSTGAVDTSVPQDLVLYGQLANSSETITLESWLLEPYSHA